MKYTTSKPLYREPKEFHKNVSREVLQYALGGMLYMPANKDIAEKIISGKHNFKSICLDLEDSVGDDSVEEAMNSIRETFRTLHKHYNHGTFDMPLIFIRVRTAEQAIDIYDTLHEDDTHHYVCGFNFPKFDSTNAEDYIDAIKMINNASTSPVYFNPIIESALVMDKRTRFQELEFINNQLSYVPQYVLNVRVGATDFCNIFGIRREKNQHIYSIRVVADCLADIVNMFGGKYVVSGPVWEYFNTEDAESGLKRELQMDKLNGFIGKTSIHPSQLQIISDEYIVSYENYQDALTVLGMNGNVIGVTGGYNNNKMNEQKTHINWAKKIIGLADVYGVGAQ